jgi:predicted  nucleic acid-binding Zn-ribbon protein
MSRLAPLLEIQNLDLATDAARSRSADLPARKELPGIQTELAALDSKLVAARSERAQIKVEEERVGRDVAQLARDIESAEVERYSGKRKNEEEAALHDQSQARLREDQGSLEEREMELLESIEAVEEQIKEHESAHVTCSTNARERQNVIDEVEAEVASELKVLEKERQGLAPQAPATVLDAYERIRTQTRSVGRGAALLEDGSCTGCRVKLPSFELTGMLAEPEEALIQCPQCRRVLVR